MLTETRALFSSADQPDLDRRTAGSFLLDSVSSEPGLALDLRTGGALDGGVFSQMVGRLMTPTLQPGARLGKYEILATLGAGGMGRVYRALDPDLGREVAIKTLLGLAEQGALERLRREAQALAALDHPNIVTIYGIEASENDRYLVMELVRGETLRDLIDREELALTTTLEIAHQLATAIAAAHRAGITHRDLKPANIVVRPDGRIKVLDFGLATPPAARSERAPAEHRTITGPGEALGTLPYMAPEQLHADPTDERTDVWGLGIVLYEMATRRRPFLGDSQAALISSILRDTPPRPSEITPQIPRSLDAIITRCIPRDPAQRYQSADELIADLDQLRQQLSDSGPSALDRRPSATEGTDSDSKRAPRTRAGKEQTIRFCSTPDGVRIAYATAGAGPPIVKAANWLNHLELDWRSPVWRHVIEHITHYHELIRYDERGNGLSALDIDDFSFEAFVQDLETVIDASGAERFALLGVSQGCPVSIAYAVANPERVSCMVLHGGYARGRYRRGDREEEDSTRALLTLMRQGWGRSQTAFQQLWAERFLPDGTAAAQAAQRELQTVTPPQNAAAILEATATIDVIELLPQVRVPTLVTHSRGDLSTPLAESELMASLIPGAELLVLENRNHLVLEHDPTWPILRDTVHDFFARHNDGARWLDA